MSKLALLFLAVLTVSVLFLYPLCVSHVVTDDIIIEKGDNHCVKHQVPWRGPLNDLFNFKKCVDNITFEDCRLNRDFDTFKKGHQFKKIVVDLYLGVIIFDDIIFDINLTRQIDALHN